MPYTEDSPKRPRKEQVKYPVTPGELTLAYTVACLEYIKNTKSCYATFARCMAALDPEFPAKPTVVKKIDSINKLRQHIAFLTDYYIAKNRESEYAIDVRASKICAQQEWYWKMMRQYEDKKCQQNGEVYPIDNVKVIKITDKMTGLSCKLKKSSKEKENESE